MLSWLKKQGERFGGWWRGRGDEASAAVRSMLPDGRRATSLPDPEAPPQGQYRPGRIDAALEYVASTQSPWYGQLLRLLPRHIDERTRDFGEDLYERMLLDDQVAASTWAVVHQVVSRKVQFSPAVSRRGEEGYRESRAICEFVERDFGDLKARSLDMWCEEMFHGAVACGNKLAEKVYEPIEAGRDAGRLGLSRLACKPRKNVAYVVNQFSHVVGIRAIMPGVQPYAMPAQLVLDPTTLPNLLPRHKFAVLTWRPKDESPQGSSLLAPAFDPWWEKRQLAEQKLRAFAQFGMPWIWGTTPEGAQAGQQRDELGNPTGGTAEEPTVTLMRLIQQMRAGGAAAFPHGTQLNALLTTGGIDALAAEMERLDGRINRAIRLATRDTAEARHGSRADSETAQDVVGTLIAAAQAYVVYMLTWDLVYWTVLANWGPEVARRYCPKAAIGTVEHQDRASMIGAVASGWSQGILTPSQLVYCHTELLGLPAPEPGELEALVAQKQGQQGGMAPGMPAPAPPGAAPGDGTVQGALPGLFPEAPAPDAPAPEDQDDGTVQSALPGLFGG